MSQTVTIESGTVVVDVDAPTIQVISSGDAISTPVAITRDGQLTVVLVDGNSDNSLTYVQLPSGCDVGDVVEIYNRIGTGFGSGNFGCHVLLPSGELFSDDAISGHGSGGRTAGTYRKVTSTLWGSN